MIFGKSGIWPASFNLTTLNGTNGFAIPGIAALGDLGYSVSTAGDLNGDGKADLVLGAWGISSGTGAAYVLFGENTSALSTTLTSPTLSPTMIPTPTPLVNTPTPLSVFPVTIEVKIPLNLNGVCSI